MVVTSFTKFESKGTTSVVGRLIFYLCQVVEQEGI